MNPGFSLYLDALRFAAAMLVVFAHASQSVFTETPNTIGRFGHSAVIVFFVLSGFVINYITYARDKTLESYATNRLARIYSVALPAILLIPILDHFGQLLRPEIYAEHTTHDLIWLRLLASTLFLNEMWGVSITAFSNPPYWSINYEFWYYVLYAVLSFTHGRQRIGLCALLALIVGPKIALLAPAWFMGVALYRWQLYARIRITTAFVLLALTGVGFWAFHEVQFQTLTATWLEGMIGKYWFREMAYSRYFISDTVLAVLITLHLAGVQRLIEHLYPLLKWLTVPIHALAARTFTLYVFHLPLMLFLAALAPWGADDPRLFPFVVVGSIAGAFLLAQFTELQKVKARYIAEKFVSMLSGVLKRQT